MRPGGAFGRVGVHNYVDVPNYEVIASAHFMFYRNVIVAAGGSAPVHAYIDELLPDNMESRIEPDRVFDRTNGLDCVPDGYRAMNECEASEGVDPPLGSTDGFHRIRRF